MMRRSLSVGFWIAACGATLLLGACVEQKRTTRYRSVLGNGTHSAMEPIKARPLPSGKWMEATQSGVTLRPGVSPLDRPSPR